MSQLKLNQVYTGKVLNIKSFGAFVELPTGDVGLLHISEVSNQYVKEVGDFLKTGQQIPVKVIELKDNAQIRLTAKVTEEEAVAAVPMKKVEKEKTFKTKNAKKPKNDTFEDKLTNYLQSSRETIAQIEKRNDRFIRKRK